MSDHPVVLGREMSHGATRRLGQFAREHLLSLPVGAVAALVWANTYAESYYRLSYALDFWVNDVAMVFFFGLLMKEVVEAREPGGVMHSWRKATVPAIAAAGGGIAAASAYIGFARLTDEPMLAQAWPAAFTTDLALSYFLARLIFGRHPVVPFILLIGLAANAAAFLAVPLLLPPVDIHALDGAVLMFAAVGMAATLRNGRVRSFWPYVLIAGTASWLALYRAGIHPGLALVPIMPFLPGGRRDPGFFVDAPADAHDPLNRFEIVWRHPVQVTLFLFGLVNGGVIVHAVETGAWAVPVAVLSAKPFGMLAAVALALAAGFHLPHRVGARDLVVASMIPASGFTIGLFMASALLAPGQLLATTKMGMLLSVVAGPLAVLLARLLRVGRFARRVR